MTKDLPVLLNFFKALAHDSRLKLLGLLAQREHSVQELAGLLELKEPTISHHLALLRALGLVRLRQDGNIHWYAFEAPVMTELAKSILSREQILAFADKVAPNVAKTSILDNFVLPDGRLKEIPASRKKRRVILAWLMQDFAPDRRYQEAEVNTLIQQHHWDSATLRRELIGYRMLARERGIYWRLDESEWRSEAEGSVEAA